MRQLIRSGAVDSAVIALLAATRRGEVTSVRDTKTSLGFRRTLDTFDQMFTYDQATIDSAGVFLISELEKLDPTLNLPLQSVTWARDMPLRTDVTFADDISSFTNSTFAAPGGVNGSNKNWAAKDASAIAGISLDIGKTPQPLTVWATQLSWTIAELQAAEKLGRPVDTQKYEGMQRKYQMDIDEQVYVGDAALGLTGFVNHGALTNTANALTGNWATATADQILADVNELLTSAWQTTGFAVCPSKVLMAPYPYTLLATSKVSSAGNLTILQFIKENSICNGLNGKPLDIEPCKWLTGTNNGNPLGVTATDAMQAYSQDRKYVRFPIVPLQRTALEYRDIRQLVTYFGRLGQVELVYSDTVARRSGLR